MCSKCIFVCLCVYNFCFIKDITLLVKFHDDTVAVFTRARYTHDFLLMLYSINLRLFSFCEWKMQMYGEVTRVHLFGLCNCIAREVPHRISPLFSAFFQFFFTIDLLYLNHMYVVVDERMSFQWSRVFPEFAFNVEKLWEKKLLKSLTFSYFFYLKERSSPKNAM